MLLISIWTTITCVEHMLLSIVALCKLIVLLLPLSMVLVISLIWILVIISVEIYLNAWLICLNIVQHVLDIAHDTRKIEKLSISILILSTLSWWHAWVCSSISMHPSLKLLEILLLFIRYLCSTIHI